MAKLSLPIVSWFHSANASTQFLTANFLGNSLRLSLVYGVMNLSLSQEIISVPGGYKYGNLALQVGGVSEETVKYGYRF
jgi:hypothetical protein